MDLVLSFVRFYLIFLAVKIFINTLFRIKVVKPRVVEEDIPQSASNSFPEADIKEAAIEMVLDEVCNTYVPINKAFQVVREDSTHYFCSWECREKFIEGNTN